MNLKVKIAGVEFKNPIIAASGTFGFGREYSQFYNLSELGGICTKGITREPRQGNATPRIAETPMGMLNSVGLQNPGVEAFIKQEAAFLKSLGVVIIANIAGSTVEDYCFVAEEICGARAVDMIELNISCPNVKQGGITFGVEPRSVQGITEAVKKHCTLPLMVKLSPNVASIADNARAAAAGGADAVSLINTLGGMAVDWRNRKPQLANVYGGLSGPCVKPVALKMVHEVYKAVKIPVVGLGGIQSAEDVMEFIVAGAAAVQVGTANFYNPYIGSMLVKDLTKLGKSCNIDDISSMTGSLKY